MAALLATRAADTFPIFCFTDHIARCKEDCNDKQAPQNPIDHAKRPFLIVLCSPERTIVSGILTSAPLFISLC